MKQDIKGRDLESGDLITYAMGHHLSQSYYLYHTKNTERMVISCARKKDANYKNEIVDWERAKSYKEHDSKIYLRRDIECLITEKQPDDIPEKLKRWIKQ